MEVVLFNPIRFLMMLCLSSALLLLSACQDSENTDKSQIDNAGKLGKVAIVLTDAPNDEFSEVNLTITQIALLRDDHDEDEQDENNEENEENSESDSEDEKVVIFEGEETVNLLALENYSHLFSLSTDVPVGTYKKIRLTLKKEQGIELVKRDENGEVSELHYPKINGNAKLDLNARKAFEVVADETLFIQLDIDAKKSIHIVKTGNGKYKFRPVVFIDVITPEFSGKLVRHSGFIRTLDLDNSSFNLCANAEATKSTVEALTELCLLVRSTEASLFDANGDAVVLGDLGNGQFVTVIGYLQPHNANSDSVIEYGQMLAQVIHAGDQENFTVVDGEVESEVDAENTFSLMLEDQTSLSVLLQSGTKVFLRDGTVANVDLIEIGSMMEVHGVFDANDATLLKATLIIVEPQADAEQEKLAGAVLEIFSDPASLTMATDNGDRTVLIAEETVVLSVDTTSETSFSEMSSLANISQDDRIEVYGVENGMGEFLANIILVVAD